MPKRDDIIQKIRALASSKYPDAEVYLFGSRAREDAKPLSDWDLLILLNVKNVSFSLETSIMDEFYEIELETGAVASPLIYSREAWLDRYNCTPLFENIKSEGVRLR